MSSHFPRFEGVAESDGKALGVKVSAGSPELRDWLGDLGPCHWYLLSHVQTSSLLSTWVSSSSELVFKEKSQAEFPS